MKYGLEALFTLCALYVPAGLLLIAPVLVRGGAAMPVLAAFMASLVAAAAVGGYCLRATAALRREAHARLSYAR